MKNFAQIRQLVSGYRSVTLHFTYLKKNVNTQLCYFPFDHRKCEIRNVMWISCQAYLPHLHIHKHPDTQMHTSMHTHPPTHTHPHTHTNTQTHKGGAERNLEVMDMFITLIVVVEIQVYTYLQTHPTVYTKCIHFLYQLYLSKYLLK